MYKPRDWVHVKAYPNYALCACLVVGVTVVTEARVLHVPPLTCVSSIGFHFVEGLKDFLRDKPLIRTYTTISATNKCWYAKVRLPFLEPL